MDPYSTDFGFNGHKMQNKNTDDEIINDKKIKYSTVIRRIIGHGRWCLICIFYTSAYVRDISCAFVIVHMHFW